MGIHKHITLPPHLCAKRSTYNCINQKRAQTGMWSACNLAGFHGNKQLICKILVVYDSSQSPLFNGLKKIPYLLGYTKVPHQQILF